MKEDNSFKFIIFFAFVFSLAIAVSIFVVEYKKRNKSELFKNHSYISQKSKPEARLEPVNNKTQGKIKKNDKNIIERRRERKFDYKKTITKKAPRYEYDTIYSWVDEKGIKHFNNTKPDNVEHYSVRKLAKSKYQPKPKKNNYSLPTYTDFSKSSSDTGNYRHNFESEKKYRVTREDLMEKIEEKKRKLKILKERVDRKKDELFDIKRKPHTVKTSGYKRDRIERKESEIEYWNNIIKDTKETIREYESAIAFGKYDKN